MNMIWPIALIVFSNIFYNVCSKSVPEGVSPFAALTVTYAVSALCSMALFFILNRGASLMAQYKGINWSVWVLGVALVGLEAGSIYMYKAGWQISTGHLVHSAILAMCLIVIGAVFYREHISWNKVVGAVICLAGLYLINR